MDVEFDNAVLTIFFYHCIDCNVRLRPFIPAIRTKESSQVGIGHIAVGIPMFTADTVHSVRKFRAMERLIAGVDAEEYTGLWGLVSNRGHKRIVGIQAKLGILSFSDGSFQFIQSMCHLTVTIQLVAEDIGENNDFWRNVVQL